MKYQLLILCIALSLFASCKCVSKSKQAEPIFVSKGACLGRCPQYNVTLNTDGNIIFEGIKYTAFSGKKSFKVTKQQNRELHNAFSKINLSQLKPKYDQYLHDYPMTTLRQKDFETSFKRMNSVPKEVETFVLLLEKNLKEQQLLR